MKATPLLALLLAPLPAVASVDPKCADVDKPSNYDEQVQTDFLNNYPALATTFSPLHAPMAHRPGHGHLGVDLAVYPPLSCEQRFVLDHTKTEETNVSPLVPKLSAGVAFPALGPVVPYLGMAYTPPIPVGGTRSSILSGEIGLAMEFAEHWQVGLRGHVTTQRTLGDVASAFDPEDPVIDDLYIANSRGVDLMGGYRAGIVTPYVSVGWTDVSTYFWVGDDGVVAYNLHPYSSVVFSVGADVLVDDHWRFVGEFYGAPGGHANPDPDAPSVKPASRYGHLYTARFRLAYEL